MRVVAITLLILIIPTLVLAQNQTNQTATNQTGITNVTNITNVTETCTDTDGGRSPFTVGNVTAVDSAGRKDVAIDTCLSSTQLLEFYCDGTRLANYTVSCTGSCQNGACVVAVPDTCTDTDGGADYRVAGNVSGTKGGKPYFYTDVCLGRFQITEYNCANNTWKQHFNVTCANIDSNFPVCQNGACVQAMMLPEPAQIVEQATQRLGTVKGKLPAPDQRAVEIATQEAATSAASIEERETAIAQRGIGYSIAQFFGLARQQELADAAFLREQADGLLTAAARLEEIAGRVEEPATSVLKEQAIVLREQAEAIQQRAAEKERGAGGIFGFLFGS